MFSNNINLNHLRYFQVVYEERSMTQAAQVLHLTQSGISQHIKALEENLNFKLFDRVKLRLVPTKEGRILYEKISGLMGDLSLTLNDIQSSLGKISGKVRIGMPIEFGNNMIAPLLSEIAREQKDLSFTLHYGFVTEMNNRLLSGDLDFAFIDSFNVDRRIKTKKVYDEQLHLCCSKKYFKEANLKSSKGQELLDLEFIDYQESAPLTELWFNHHFGMSKVRMKMRASVMDVQGVARLILGHMGAGILPTHLLQKLEKEGAEIHRFNGSGKALINSIELAQLKDHTLSHAAEFVLNRLMKAF